MALDDIFAKTDTGQEEPQVEKKNFPIGVYLTQAERDEIDAIAKNEDISRHAFLQYAIRVFVARYKSGDEKLETKTVKVLDPPK